LVREIFKGGELEVREGALKGDEREGWGAGKNQILNDLADVCLGFGVVVNVLNVDDNPFLFALAHHDLTYRTL